VVNIPNPVDLAIIVVSAPQVPSALQECVQKGIKAAVIISAGFAESDGQGRKLENKIVEIAQRGGVRFVGPNSMGHADTLSQLYTLAWQERIPTGPVALISQSGFYGGQIIRKGMESGIGFSKLISTGNEADLHMEDYLEYLAQDEETKIIVAYMEGLREGRRFFQLAKETTVRKPIVVIKAGGTKESARAARSHTGALAGSDAVYTAAFKQAGVIRVDGDDELCDAVMALLGQPLPRSNRIGILTVGGGPGVVAAEACEKEGLTLAPLSASTMEKLNSWLPSRWSHGNPVDVAGITARYRGLVFASLWALMEDENVDAVLFQVPLILNSDRLSTALRFNPEETRAFRETQKESLIMVKEQVKEHGKPVFMTTLARDDEASSFLNAARIPAYSSPQRAARALSHLVWYGCYLDTHHNPLSR